jgi:hypothetical protein
MCHEIICQYQLDFVDVVGVFIFLMFVSAWILLFQNLFTELTGGLFFVIALFVLILVMVLICELKVKR